MIVVNNGYGDDQFHTLNHSKWNGLTACDLVFPFFLFMVGVSAYLSLRKYQFVPSGEVIMKMLMRSVLFFLIGEGLHVWEMVIHGHTDIFANLRLWGVMQRIALCYCFISLLLLYVKPKALMSIAGGILVVYSLILLFGNGYAQDETNILCIADRWLVSSAHLYRKSPVDPEGLVGTLSSFAHVTIGAYIGYSICHKTELTERMKRVSGIGAIMLVVGLVVAIWLPLNKRVWSTSYVLVTCAISSFVLIALTYIADHKNKSKWFDPFRRAGLHAFAIYVASEMIAPVVGVTGIADNAYSALCNIFSPAMSSFIYSLLFAMCFLAACYIHIPKKGKLLSMVLLLIGCDRGVLDSKYVPEGFVSDVKVSYTSIKNQGRSELCWVYAILSTIESDYMKDRNDTVNLSAKYLGRKYLEERALDYFRSKGSDKISLRGVGPMTLELIDRYGLMPMECYESDVPVDFMGLAAYVMSASDDAISKNVSEERFVSGLTKLLDERLGVVPDTFVVNDLSFTPLTYADTVMADRSFVTMMSNAKKPYKDGVNPDLTDNRFACLATNVKSDSLVVNIIKSLNEGKAVMWEGGPNDNHAVAIVGLGHDKRGKKYFLAKNSWGTNNPTLGYLYIPVDYTKKHTALVVF